MTRPAGPCTPYCDAAAVQAQYPAIDPSVAVGTWGEVASEILYALTGQQFDGICTVTIRPGHQSCSCGGACGAHAFGWPFSGGWGGYWGLGGIALAASMSPSPMLLCASQIPLGQDARAVSSVRIDGQEIDPATWRLDPGGLLVRQPDPVSGARLAWPCCQRVDAPSGSPGTFEVAYSFGADPPASLVQAAITFAGELSLSASPLTSDKCRLPARTQTLTRQGVTAALIADLTVLIERGYLGIPAVDWVIKAFNPNHIQRRARAISPDVPPHHLTSLGP